MTSNNPVLRVTQLDTVELNETIQLSIKQSIHEDFFKYIQYNFVHKYHIEIYSALKFILWYHTYAKSGQTVAQSILNWSYASNNKLVLIKKIAHCLIYCLDEWFEEKFIHLIKKIYHYIKSKNENSSQINEQMFEKILNYSNIFIKFMSLCNYIVFLFNGKYLTIWERLLNLRPVYKNQRYLNTINSDASIREEMWYSCFTLFKLTNSLFNLNKLKKSFFKTNQSSILINNNNNKEDECLICNSKEPTLAHIDAANKCKHVFCYVCIQKEILDNNNQYNCNICSTIIKNIEPYYKNENI